MVSPVGLSRLLSVLIAERGQQRRKSTSMSMRVQSKLPQTGYFLDEEWADAMNVDPKTFRQHVRSKGVPHIQLGARMIVSAEDFYSHLKAQQEGTALEDD